MAIQNLPPAHARVVIIGGGVSGCSTAYHLAKRGWKDVVLLERKQLTSGTTWHAAGLVGQLRSSINLTRMAKYSAELYLNLEKDTGIATGMRQCGSITVALTQDRYQELLRNAAMAKAFGVEVEMIDVPTLKKIYPHLNTDGAVGAAHLPGDGQCDPANIALALAKGARMNGVSIFEHTKVKDVITKDGQVKGVSWQNNDGSEGTIHADIVVNTGGMWGRDLAAQSGVSLPLHACEHFYIVTEPIPELGTLPVMRVPDEYAYYKEDAGKILLGAFEPVAKPWGMKDKNGKGGIPEDFCFDQLPEDFAHFEPILEMAINRLPILSTAGIHTFFNGPESFTPDDSFYLGEAPFLKGYFIAAGYNSIGIVSSGGAGHALAHWIDEGHPPFDLWGVDIRRAMPFQRNRLYLKNRVTETLGLLYADHYPYRQKATARGVRRSPLHEHLKQAGAVFGEVAGFERANWFADAGQKSEYHYGWGRQNWFNNNEREHMAVRESIGLFDMSSFGKIRVDGADALPFMQRLCANQMDVANGKIVYTQMLNEKGGIESDLTVTRLDKQSYFLVVPAATLQRDLSWLARHRLADERVVINDISAGEAVIVLMGPNVRSLLADISPDDFGNEAFPFGSAREVEMGMGITRAHRVSYVGELGFEFYVSSDQAAHIFETIQVAGRGHGLKLCGLHALDSCRIEKAYRHFGHDITDEDHVLEAGLGFAVKPKKGEFIGRQAVLDKQQAGLSRQLVQFRLLDPNPLLFHNEPIIVKGKTISYLTSGNYGHALKGAIGLGYVPCQGISDQELLAETYHIDVAGQLFEAEASLKPLYDPTSARMKL